MPRALEILEREAFDAVVTDMRMPGMDGAELLDEVKRRHPHVVRIVLSGQADQASVLRSPRLDAPVPVQALRSRHLEADARARVRGAHAPRR